MQSWWFALIVWILTKASHPHLTSLVEGEGHLIPALSGSGFTRVPVLLNRNDHPFDDKPH